MPPRELVSRPMFLTLRHDQPNPTVRISSAARAWLRRQAGGQLPRVIFLAWEQPARRLGVRISGSDGSVSIANRGDCLRAAALAPELRWPHEQSVRVELHPFDDYTLVGDLPEEVQR